MYSLHSWECFFFFLSIINMPYNCRIHFCHCSCYWYCVCVCIVCYPFSTLFCSFQLGIHLLPILFRLLVCLLRNLDTHISTRSSINYTFSPSHFCSITNCRFRFIKMHGHSYFAACRWERGKYQEENRERERETRSQYAIFHPENDNNDCE